MTDQLDMFAARAARDAGIQRAVDHADAVSPKWSELAFDFAVDYARKHPRFTGEDVREASVGSVTVPPDSRAWGGVMQRLGRAGYAVKDGYGTARDPKVHCNVITVWRSLLCQEPSP